MVPMKRARAEREWFDADGEKQACANCGRQTSAHWHTLEAGVSALCAPCGDWVRDHDGEMRPTEQPVRGRKRQQTGLEDCPCQSCGVRPGRYPFWGRGSAGQVICVPCRDAGLAHTRPRLVPRVCTNRVCRATESTMWVGDKCGACYHYARKNSGEARPRDLVVEGVLLTKPLNFSTGRAGPHNKTTYTGPTTAAPLPAGTTVSGQQPAPTHKRFCQPAPPPPDELARSSPSLVRTSSGHLQQTSW